MTVKSQQLSAGGSPIAIRVALALKEWIADTLLLSKAKAVMGFAPLGIISGPQSEVGAGASVLTPGVSVLLSTLLATGANSPNLEASDVPAGVIVRSAAQ
jgi:hypothetical protein